MVLLVLPSYPISAKGLFSPGEETGWQQPVHSKSVQWPLHLELASRLPVNCLGLHPNHEILILTSGAMTLQLKLSGIGGAMVVADQLHSGNLT